MKNRILPLKLIFATTLSCKKETISEVDTSPLEWDCQSYTPIPSRECEKYVTV